MRVTMQSTTRLVEIDGVPARVWEGETDSGIPVAVLVTSIAVPPGHDTAQFERELIECARPTPLGAEPWPARMVRP
jgi:hypothetical protein